MSDQVVVEFALRAEPAGQLTELDLGVGHVEIDHADDVETLEEALRSTLVAREAVDHESEVPVVFASTRLDDGLDEIIADEFARVHRSAHLRSDLGVVRSRSAV